MDIYNVIDKCNGCNHNDGDVCACYMRPRAKWTKFGGCEGATHVKREIKETAVKVRVGQQKQKKE